MMIEAHFTDDDGIKYWFSNPDANKIWIDSLKHVSRIDVNRWILRDKLHRLDGPAVVHKHGHGEFWINGNQLQNRYEFAINVIMILLECNRAIARHVFDEIVNKACFTML